MGLMDNLKTTREPTDVVEMELLNHCVCHGTSFLAASEFEEDHALAVHPSSIYADMWYLGVVESGVYPYRDSEYFPTQEGAAEALDGRTWTQRMDTQ
jgi:hypothetical protein